MANLKYTNGGAGTLGSSYTAGASTLTLNTGQGATFPSTGDFWVAVDSPASFYLKCTARSSDTLTVATTGADGSTAVNKAINTAVTEVWPVAAIDQFRSDINQFGAFASLPSTGVAKLGDRYKCTDSPYDMAFNGTLWVPFIGGVQATDPTLQTWAWINQSTGSIDTSKGGIYLLATATATTSFRIREKSTPSTPYTCTFGIMPNILGPNYQRSGVCWRNSSSGKLMGFYVQCNTNIWLLEYDTWTDAVGSGGVSIKNYPFLPFGPVVWLRLADDGTTRTFSYSLNGQFFITFYSETRATFATPDKIGFLAADASNALPAATWLLSYLEA